MAQFGRPISDISIGSWTDDAGATTAIYDTINESVASDVDYIEAINGSNTTGEFGLTVLTDPASSINHIIRFRMQATGSGAPERCQVQLFQGVTQIATTGNQTNRGSWGDKTYTLSAVEADSITDYGDLRFKIISSNLGGTEDMWVSWCEFEIPDVILGWGNVINTVATYTKINGIGISNITKVNGI